MVTDADGHYCFSGLFTGDYTLTETLQDGWKQTLAPDGVSITSSGQEIDNVNFGNFKLGEICGVKFNDLNGNGKKDDGEPGLAGWTITLTPGGATMVTDADGHYCFSGLFTGDYTLTETLQDGWKQTLAPDGVSITSSGQEIDNVNFGNFKLGEICGVKFNDLNGNGKKDDGEPGLAGWTITLTPGGATMVTDADGHYCFSGLFTGDYTLTETLQDGWKQTLAPDGVSITSSGQEIDDVNFGNFKLGEICGVKFNDLNGNGKKDDGEPGLAGWTITLTPGGATMVTDADGHYCFSGLFTGDYTLTETLQDGWKQTLAPDGVSITSSGQEIDNVNFGNFKLGEICGVKFNDLNGNGKKDDGEPGLAGWTITLTPGGATMVTDADGHYCFEGLFTGDYTLTETLQDGWKQTLAPDGVSITSSGQEIDNVNFGNFKLGEICGVKFNDLNGNGKKDDGEPGLAGWTITLTPGGATMVTDADGHYCFSGLFTGDYTLTETLQDGWKQTLAPDGVSITSSGQEIDNVNFGNFKLGEICGVKFNDLNGNGKKGRWRTRLSGLDHHPDSWRRPPWSRMPMATIASPGSSPGGLHADRNLTGRLEADPGAGWGEHHHQRAGDRRCELRQLQAG